MEYGSLMENVSGEVLKRGVSVLNPSGAAGTDLRVDLAFKVLRTESGIYVRCYKGKCQSFK